MSQEQTNRKDKDDHVNEELRLLYQTSIFDIAFFKQQQWRVTNYGLLLYGVIVAIPKILDYDLSTYEYFVLFLIAFVVCAVGWYLVGSLEESLSKGRARLFKAKDSFSMPFKDAWRCGKSENEVPKGPEDKPSLLWLFRSVVGLGFLIVSWLLYKMACSS